MEENLKLNNGLKMYSEKVKKGEVIRPKPMDPIEKAKQNPKSLRMAINARCFICSGFQKKEVKSCEFFDCRFHALRPWSKDKRSYREKSEMGTVKPLRKMNPIEKSIQNPKSLRMAINAECWDCCCEQKTEVKHCTVVDCPLYPRRPWQEKKKPVNHKMEEMICQ